MGGIAVGGGHGGKKSLDSEIPLVPFIDLLLCCVMFLLVTAVWNQLARINANQQAPSSTPADTPPPDERQIKMYVQVQNGGFIVGTTAGERQEIRKNGDAFDFQELRDKLRTRREAEPARRDCIVVPEDGVLYKDVVATMDIVVGEGYPEMTVTDTVPQ